MPVPRGRACNRGITRDDGRAEKAACVGTDQTGMFPLKSAAWVAVCSLMLRVTAVQVCVTVGPNVPW